MKFLRTFLLGLAVAIAAPLIGIAPQQLGQQLAHTAPAVSAALIRHGAALDSAITPSAFAAGVSTDTSTKIAGHVWRATAYTAPTTICWALLTSAPSDSSTGATISEASYTGYARGQLNPSTSNYTAPTSTGQSCNNATITFGSAATSGPTVVTHFAALDSCTIGSGNVIVYGTLTASKTVNNGDPAPTAPASAMCSTLGD